MDRCWWDHPHIHGEYAEIWSPELVTQGSPPHTWGIRLKKHGYQHATRITPTYMGNTQVGPAAGGKARDHPHIHGEYKKKNDEKILEAGSPPHTWGIPDTNQAVSTIPGITPTYMGNTRQQLGAGG